MTSTQILLFLNPCKWKGHVRLLKCLLIAIFQFASPPGFSDCQPPSVAEALKNSDVVFSATVVTENLGSSALAADVIEVFKGPTKKQYRLKSTAYSEDEAALEPGEKYLIYGKLGQKDVVYPLGCTASKPLSAAKKDLVDLADGVYESKDTKSLIQSLRNTDSTRRLLAIEALAKRNKYDTPEIEKALVWALMNDLDPFNRRIAVQGLAGFIEIGSDDLFTWQLPSTFQVLQEVAKKGGPLGNEALMAIVMAPAKLCPEAVASIFAAIDQPPRGSDVYEAFARLASGNCQWEALDGFGKRLRKDEAAGKRLTTALERFLSILNDESLESTEGSGNNWTTLRRVSNLLLKSHQESDRILGVKLLNKFIVSNEHGILPILIEHSNKETSAGVKFELIEGIAFSESSVARRRLCSLWRKDPNKRVRRYVAEHLGEVKSEVRMAIYCKTK